MHRFGVPSGAELGEMWQVHPGGYGRNAAGHLAPMKLRGDLLARSGATTAAAPEVELHFELHFGPQLEVQLEVELLLGTVAEELGPPRRSSARTRAFCRRRKKIRKIKDVKKLQLHLYLKQKKMTIFWMLSNLI